VAITIRYRFVALALAEGWIELTRKPRWELRHPERAGTLMLSVFPVVDGVEMDLPTLLHLTHERRRTSLFRQTFVDESTWSIGSLFCVTTRHTSNIPTAHYSASWTVSDGHYVVEGTFSTDEPSIFLASLPDCDAMLRSLRFEGPN
jgi:hypothetical protein